jgi:hypothetical protein
MSFEVMTRRPEDGGMSRRSSPIPVDAVVIRPAYPDDGPALARLAALDSRRALTGRVLVAERDGRLLAALATEDGRAIADPFAPTAGLVALLRLRAAEAVAPRPAPSFRRRPAVARG